MIGLKAFMPIAVAAMERLWVSVAERTVLLVILSTMLSFLSFVAPSEASAVHGGTDGRRQTFSHLGGGPRDTGTRECMCVRLAKLFANP